MIVEHSTQYYRPHEIGHFHTDTTTFNKRMGNHALMPHYLGDLRQVTHIIPTQNAEHAQTHVYYAGTPNLHHPAQPIEIHALAAREQRNRQAAEVSLRTIERTEGRHSPEAVALRAYLRDSTHHS